MGWLVFDWQDPEYKNKDTMCRWCKKQRGGLTPSGETRFYPLCGNCFHTRYRENSGGLTWEELCAKNEAQN